MRILHVVPTYLPATRYGGPIHSVHGLCSALAELGHDVHVATTSVDGDRDSEVRHGCPVMLDGIQVWYFRSRALRRLYFAPDMRRWLRGRVQQFDLVHLHSVFLWPTSMAARLAARAGVPYVVSPRGMLVRELIERRNPGIKGAWLALVESRTLGDAAAVHLTSRRELEDTRMLPLPMPAPFVLPNGVEQPKAGYQARASARIRNVGARGPYALYLGRISWKKGLDRVLEALVGTDIHLVICGNDDESHRPTLERIVIERELRKQVTFEDAVSNPDKWALLAAARFVVLASYNENFGNVVTEAMAVGRPVVVTSEVGAAEILREAGAGLVSDGGQPELRAAMRRLWNDAELSDALGAAGRSYVADRLSWPRIAARMLERYERILATKNNPHSCAAQP